MAIKETAYEVEHNGEFVRVFEYINDGKNAFVHTHHISGKKGSTCGTSLEQAYENYDRL